MTKYKLATFVAFAGLLALSAPARAQCTKDTDCKGDRICINGACTSPAPAPSPYSAPAPAPTSYTTAPAPYAQPAPAYAPRPMRTGWATGAGALGIASGVLVFGLALGAEALNGTDEALPVGIAATTLFAAMSPVVAGGAGSARSDPRVDGLLGMRILGWTTYGLGMANALVLVAIGLADGSPDTGLITLAGGLGLVSLVSLSIDAFVSGAEARRLARDELAATSTSDESPRLGLSIAPLWRESQLAGGMVGVGGVF
ncbi:MAG: dickkopf-related protein [Myxococcales bacterium]